ncbi:sugar phosphate isomerase/epimerase family protein [Peristeroidobacter soli]|jgi:sugar phosphate isomerase/epimerase|uniref:sugar phosphate isomerase/epimerase family protein n=1 Tax=Peristeroidobacter soli TaxID=2497877 RepID=UPI00101CE503|nr:sugar phosphate isomerase/epimerase family protein [Peristeroidobacter soli]
MQSYSFRDRPLQQALQAMSRLGIEEGELYSPHIEFGGVAAQRVLLGMDPASPAQRATVREELRRWRLEVSLQHFADVAAQWRRAGIRLNAYNLSFRDDWSDAEIDRGFQMARALDASLIASSSTLSVLPRVASFADKYGMIVAVHNHAGLNDANEITGPESIARALAISPRIRVNLDIGHFSADGHDPVEFIREHHERITHLHLKDRRNHDGPAVPFGEGDTPLREVLLLMKARGYDFPGNIEYEYKSANDAEVEVGKCLDYCRRVLGQ